MSTASIQDRIHYIIGQVLAETATSEELAELDEYILNDQDGTVTAQLESLLAEPANKLAEAHGKWDHIVDNVLAADKIQPADIVSIKPEKNIFRLVVTTAAAAAILITAGIGFYWMFKKENNNEVIASTKLKKNPAGEIHNQGSKAILTLSDGSTINLDSATGTLALQGEAKIVQLEKGQLSYHDDIKGGAAIMYNTITVPRGGHYQVTLADGSRVWLNAASSLRFPAEFSGDQRAVSLEGEAYFEVAKNETQPFIVSVNGVKVRVLGTHFNIMAYDDEGVVKTTLLEGKVAVENAADKDILQPGQQAVSGDPTKALKVLNKVDVEEVVAWKNGLFKFNDLQISALMRQVSRWYDIEIVYDKNANPDKKLDVSIDRNIKLASFIKALNLAGVTCRIENNKLVVSH